jgi:hypothetical protein
MPNVFEQQYRFTDDTTLDPLELNTRFKSLDARLAALEAEKASLEALIVELRAEGVTRLTANLQSTLPDILADAESGYLNGLADGSVGWSKLDLATATPADIGAEVAGAVATHEATPGVHSISDVADLASTLAGKQNYSALLTAISGETPIDGGLIVGTGTTYQVEQLIAGDSIAITRNAGQIRIDATGSASGESNEGVSFGTGAQVYRGKVGTDLEFRSLLPAHSAITITENTNTVDVGFNPAAVVIGLSQVTNLQAELDAKQRLADNLTALAELTPTDGQMVFGTGTGFEMGSLLPGNNITITEEAGGLRIAAAAAGEANTASNLGTGRKVFKQKSGVNLEFRSLSSLAGFLTLTETTSQINVDFNTSSFLSGLGTNAIDWSKVNKTGAAPGDVGAETAGAVAAHAGGSGVHSIAGVSGLQTALDARVQLVKSSVQTMDTSIAIQHAALSGTSPTPNAGTDNYWDITLTGNTTIQNPSNLPSGKLQILTFVIDAGTGGYSLSWGSAYNWSDQGQPTWDLTAGAVNIVAFLHRGGQLYCLGHQSF